MKESKQKRMSSPRPPKNPKPQDPPRGYFVLVEGDLNKNANVSVIAQGVPEALGPSILLMAAKSLERKLSVS